MSTAGERPTQAVIFAGGLGTRLGALTESVPKPMVPIAGRPFLEHLLGMLRGQGFERILLLLGYRPDPIIEHFGDGSAWGLEITYSVTPAHVQTLTRLRAAAALLDPVAVMAYCDNYVPLDFATMWEQFAASDAAIQVTAYANDDNYTRNNMQVEPDGQVLAYDPARTASGLNRVDIGFAITDFKRLGTLPSDDLPFEHAVYPNLVRAGALRSYVTGHRYYSIGSLGRLPLTERFFTGRPTVIVDRDGVLNRRMPVAQYVSSPEQFEWLGGALEGLRQLADAGFRILVVTNQAGIARGVMSPQQLDAVHRKLLDDTQSAGVRIERIYHCPHGWDDGCPCRKPAPGMLFEAQRDFDLNLSHTVYVGDDERDHSAARAAGMRYMHIDERTSLLDVARELTREVAAAV